MKNGLKTFFQFILLWIIALVITLTLVIPNTAQYKNALSTYDQVMSEKQIDIPSLEFPYKYGYAIGYIAGSQPQFYVWILLIQTLIVVGFLLLLKRISYSKRRALLLTDPAESVKNVLANVLLFTFGIFLKRASEQLKFYFNMPARSRIIGLLAYAFIFIAVTISYKIPIDSIGHQFLYIMYVQVSIPILLIFLTLFVKPFRKKFQRRLLWLSIGGLFLTWILSLSAGIHLSQTQLEGSAEYLENFSFMDANTLLLNLLIVLAFSFYIEVMKQVSTQKARYEAEMVVAQRIQNELLPVLDLNNESYELYGKTESAHEVGGDYCDAITLPDGRLVVAVGDVSGHNVAAGVMMSMLKVAFRTELNYLDDPRHLVESLNRTVYEHKNKAMFISFLFVLYDPAEKRLTLINCGHPPLLHVSKTENRILQYRTGDVALGLQPDAQFSFKSVPYSAGDCFVFISDGLIESANAYGEELELDRVSEVAQTSVELSPKALYDSLLSAANDFRGQVPQRDDVTVVVLKIK